MKFSYAWIKEFVPLKETPKQLAEFLTLHAFEVESQEKKAGDIVFDIKLLPNRVADASGHVGMAREIGALKGARTTKHISRITEDKKQKTADLLKVKIDVPGDCPRYTARIMTDVRVGPSPKWLRERLEVCGLQSINNIVDATNYVMLELGQPLHAFDWDKLGSNGSQKKSIIVRRAEKGETIETLDKKIYKLTPEVLLITDGQHPLAIAGIKGGMASGITKTTHTIVLESANFNPARVRTASQLLRLKTDASYRFEHGMDPNETVQAVDRLAELIQELAGGNIVGGITDVYPKKVVAQKILFSASDANRLLGKELELSFYQKAFLRIGCAVAAKNHDALLVTPPTVRRDLVIPEDLTEEAGRILGYENIPPQLPESAMIPASRNDEHYWEDRVRDFAIGSGFTESMLYAFTGDRELGQFFLNPETAPELENPLSPETKYLVPRVLIKYVTSAVENLRNFDTVKIFGMGKSFVRMAKNVDEHTDLIFVSAAKNTSGEQEFYELKGMLDHLFETLGIDDQWYDDALTSTEHGRAAKLYHPYRVAQIKIGDDTIGMIGEIHPAILDNLKSRGRIVAAELNFDRLWKHAEDEIEFRPIGKYPAIIRDIAIVVPIDTKTETVQNIIENTAGSLLIDSDLFDYFQDKEMELAGMKNFAFHLIFQSPDRTLTDTEIEKLVTKVMTALEANNWEVRK